MFVAIAPGSGQHGNHLAKAFLRLAIGGQNAQAALQLVRRALDGVHDFAVDADRAELRLEHDTARRAALRKLGLMQHTQPGDRCIHDLNWCRARECADRLNEGDSMKAPPF